MGKDTRITVDLKNEDFYRAVRVAAIDRGTSVTELVCEALKELLRKQEAREDLEAYQEVKDDPSRSMDDFLAEIGESRSGLATQD